MPRLAFFLVSPPHPLIPLSPPPRSPRGDYDYRSGTSVKKKIPITHTMRCLKIKGKSYGSHGLLWNFMVEDELDYGRANIAKFGARNNEKDQIEALYHALRSVVEAKRKARDAERGVNKYGVLPK